MDSQLLVQPTLDFNFDLPSANLSIPLLCGVHRLLHHLQIFLPRVYSDTWLEKLQETLYDDALEELDVLVWRIGGERDDLGAGGLEEVLERLFAGVQEAESGFVGKSRLCAMID